MNEEKQIEEMAKVTMKHCEIDNQCGSCHWSTCNECLAEVFYNAGYRKQSEWISVEERLPRISDKVLCYIKEYDSIDIYAYTGTDEWDNDRYCGSAKYIGITHWMPLPEPPKMKG